MKDAVSVHVVYCLQKLVHVVLNLILRKVMAAAFYSIVHVHVHKFENKSETTCRLVVEDFIQLNYLWVWRKASQSLDLSQVVYL